MNPDIEKIFSKYDKEISDLGYNLRKFVISKLDNIIENADIPANMIAYGYGPKYNDMICTIIASKKGMKLGFYKGSELPDLDKLLTGSGKVHKYVEIKNENDIKHHGVTELLKEAVNAYRMRISKQ